MPILLACRIMPPQLAYTEQPKKMYLDNIYMYCRYRVIIPDIFEKSSWTYAKW